MYQIETNVPMPDFAPKFKLKYPFLEMKVGDSFFVPSYGRDKLSLVRSAWSSPTYRKKLSASVKFQACNVRERRAGEMIEGVRCWRVA